MEIYLDPEEKIQCPYNNSHFILRKRMNVHLTKCKRNYPEAALVECDFNVNHKIPEPELQYHHEHCRDRKKMEIVIYQDKKTDLNKYPIVNIHVPTEENWDNDNVATYDPQKYCESNEIIRHMDVASAAKRRNFRVEERKRIAMIRENESGTSAAAAATSEVKIGRANDNLNRTDLPVVRRAVTEETPEAIAEIIQRIRLGANQSYIPEK